MFWQLMWVLQLCYGLSTAATPTCTSSSTDNYCYCLLDPTADAESWYIARSQCRRQLGGDLVDIASVAKNTFVRNQISSRSPAWLGVNDLKTEGTFQLLLDPSIVVPFDPEVGASPTVDTLSNCVVVGEDGSWSSVPCGGSIAYSALCRVQTVNEFGYDAVTGCPANTVKHTLSSTDVTKCYGVYTISSQMDTGVAFGVALDYCQGLQPAGQLALPLDDGSNNVIHELARQSELPQFWLRIEYSADEKFYVHGSAQTEVIPYTNWMDGFTEPSSVFIPYTAYLIKTDTGDWLKDFATIPSGVICEFDHLSDLPSEQPTIPPSVASELCPSGTNTGNSVLVTISSVSLVLFVSFVVVLVEKLLYISSICNVFGLFKLLEILCFGYQVTSECEK